MAVRDFASQRLFVEHDLIADTDLETSREQANYLMNVLRLREGDRLLIFNGKQGEWSASVVPTGRKSCQLRVEEQLRQQPVKPDLICAFAPLKQARLDYVVQKAVEMGAGKLEPVITERTQVRVIKQQRIRANMIEAAEQCGVLHIPDISNPMPLDQWLQKTGPDRVIVFCDEAAPQASPLQALAAIEKGHPVAVLIGPEGGFSQVERDLVLQHPSTVAISLGPRVMRADTACVAALAIVQATIGDW